MSGDLNYLSPGETVSATLVADGSGNVPTRGDGLEITGEKADGVEVTAVTSPENFVAQLVDVPADYDPDASYSAGDVVGKVMIRVTHHVDWLPDADGSAAAGGQVVYGSGGGVRAYDNAGGDTADQIIGTVFTTLQKDEGTSDKVAVIRQRR